MCMKNVLFTKHCCQKMLLFEGNIMQLQSRIRVMCNNLWVKVKQYAERKNSHLKLVYYLDLYLVMISIKLKTNVKKYLQSTKQCNNLP